MKVYAILQREDYSSWVIMGATFDKSKAEGIVEDHNSNLNEFEMYGECKIQELEISGVIELTFDKSFI